MSDLTTEKLAELLAIAEKAAEPNPHPSGCRCMKEFEREFRPASVAALVREVIRLREATDAAHTCVVCSALLLESDAPPHCMDCVVTDEVEEQWRESRIKNTYE